MRLSNFLYGCVMLCGAVVFLAGCTTGLFIALHVQIFPAPEWLARMQWAAILGFVVALPVMVALLLVPPPATSRLAARPRPEMTVGRVLTMAFGSLLFALAFADAVERLPVWVAAKLWGQEMELAFTVAEDPGFSDRKCPNAVRLADAPMFSDKVCGMSKEAQMSYAKGDPILIRGQGTAIGLIGEGARHP